MPPVEERRTAEEVVGIKVAAAEAAYRGITGKDNGKEDKKGGGDGNEEDDRVNAVSCGSLV